MSVENFIAQKGESKTDTLLSVVVYIYNNIYTTYINLKSLGGDMDNKRTNKQRKHRKKTFAAEQKKT